MSCAQIDHLTAGAPDKRFVQFYEPGAEGSGQGRERQKSVKY